MGNGGARHAQRATPTGSSARGRGWRAHSCAGRMRMRASRAGAALAGALVRRMRMRRARGVGRMRASRRPT
jgi:hypothetical protein